MTDNSIESARQSLDRGLRLILAHMDGQSVGALVDALTRELETSPTDLAPDARNLAAVMSVCMSITEAGQMLAERLGQETGVTAAETLAATRQQVSQGAELIDLDRHLNAVASAMQGRKRSSTRGTARRRRGR